MAAYKVPSFAERAEASKTAKARALERLRNAAQPAEPTEADAAPTPSAREIAAAKRRAEHRAAIEQEKAARAEARAKAKADAEAAAAARRPAAPPKVPTASELKAARDARYAARKARARH